MGHCSALQAAASSICFFFRKGGERPPPSLGASPDSCRAHSVLGLVALHSMEFRRWRPVWRFPGVPKEWDQWHYMDGPIPKHQDRLQPMAHDVGVFAGPEDKYSSWPRKHMDFHKPASTIVVPHRTRLGYWARDVAVVSLPQLLVWFQDHRAAADLEIGANKSYH